MSVDTEGNFGLPARDEGVVEDLDDVALGDRTGPTEENLDWSLITITPDEGTDGRVGDETIFFVHDDSDRIEWNLFFGLEPFEKVILQVEGERKPDTSLEVTIEKLGSDLVPLFGRYI